MGISFLTLKSEFTVAFLLETVVQIAPKARADLATLQQELKSCFQQPFLVGWELHVGCADISLMSSEYSTPVPVPLLFWKEISKLLYSQKRTSPVFRLQSQACMEAGRKQSPTHPCEKKKQNTRTQVPNSRVIHEVKITCASVYIVQLQFQKAKKC